MKKFSRIASALALTGALAVIPFAAFADTNLNVNVNGDVNGNMGDRVDLHAKLLASTTVPTTVGATVSLANAKSRADAEIERRINNLNSLASRINSMKLLSASEKTALQASINTQVTALTNLKAKIDAETVAANVKTDLQSITKDYRIYLLVLPQVRIAAAADRVETIISDVQTLAPKLQARITASQSAGKDVTSANSAYADMQAKIADANTQATAAVNETASLMPDQGNASVEASNKAALKDASAKLKTATADLKAARADIATILKVVKGTGSVTASSSEQVH